MQAQTVNYSIKNTSRTDAPNNPDSNQYVFNWMPGLYKPSQSIQTQALFELNKTIFKDHINSNQSINQNKLEGSFVGIQEVVSIILAQEKHKVSRNEVTEGTYRMTKVRLETNITEFFFDTDLRSINMASIQQFINFLSDKELSTPTIVGYIAQLRKVLRYLVEKDVIAQMPLFPKMKVTQKPRGAFTVTEYAAILRQAKTLRNHVYLWDKPDTRFHIKPQYRSMPMEMNWLLRFMVYTFLRPGDIRQLKNKHLEIISGKFNYLRLTPPEIKRHKAPTVSLPQAVNIYKTILKHQTAQGFGKPEDYVFFSGRKKPLAGLEHHWLAVQLDHEFTGFEGRPAWRRPQLLQLAPHGHHVSLDLRWQYRLAHLGPKRPHLGGNDREVLCVHLVSRNEHSAAAQQEKVLGHCDRCVEHTLKLGNF